MSATNATKLFGLRSAPRLNPYVPRQAQGRRTFLSSSSATTSAVAPIGGRSQAGVSPIRHRASSSRSYATSSLDSVTTSSQASAIAESRKSVSSTRSASASESDPHLGLGSGPDSSPVISRATFQKLHKLSALNPPLEGSEEEAELMQGLSDLINLMDKVKSVELPESVDERAGLLVEGIGIGEVVVSDKDLDWNQAGFGQGQGQGQDSSVGSGSEDSGRGGSKNDGSVQEVGAEYYPEPEKRGKELLGWATNRVGDFYASRIKPKS